jgi:hypothetical protein
VHPRLIQSADTPQARPVESRPAAAAVQAPAADLLLALWKRRAASPEWISGDIAAANAF